MSNSSRYSRHPENYIRTLRWQADKADGEKRLKSVTSQVNSLDWALFQALAKELGISASWLLHTALTEFLTSGRKLPPAPEVIDKTLVM